MGMMKVKTLMSQCLPTSWKGRMMTTCHGPSQERSPSHCSTNWQMRTTTLTFPQDNVSSKRVLDGVLAPTGYGLRTFISHNQLDHNADQNCQYLKDDCLYFRIEVKAAEPVKPWLTCTIYSHMRNHHSFGSICHRVYGRAISVDITVLFVHMCTVNNHSQSPIAKFLTLLPLCYIQNCYNIWVLLYKIDSDMFTYTSHNSVSFWELL